MFLLVCVKPECVCWYVFVCASSCVLCMLIKVGVFCVCA